MNKSIISVPRGIRFLGNWKEFSLEKFPKKCIINKRLPGCGFTEYCINSDSNLILASPRKQLLWNKYEQHKKDVFLVINEMESDIQVDGDLNKGRSQPFNFKKFETPEEILIRESNVIESNKRAYERIKRDLIDYYYRCSNAGTPVKILVTYDSYRIVKDILSKELYVFNKFYTVIDEFQSILHDSRFKSDTELQFMQALEQSPTAYFASATPMLEEYLDMLDEFKDLPYFELDWSSLDPGRVTIPNLDVRVMRTVTEEGCRIVNELLDGKYEEKIIMRDGVPTRVVSDKIILYVNSIVSILSIIKRTNLSPKDVNIICANTEENQKRILKKLGKNFHIGKVPLRDEPEPRITFCTRTVYLGADFYSTCARTYIFSDANIDSLAVDISEDLPQILGRQRLDENPWKNHAYFFYKATADYRGMGKEFFDMEINKKTKKTNDLLKAYNTSLDEDVKNSLAEVYQDNAKAFHYKKNYVAVNRVVDKITSEVRLVPLMNRLVLVNEIRAFRIQQIDYKDRFTVFAKISKEFPTSNISKELSSPYIFEYFSLKTIGEKLRYICNLPNNDLIKIIVNQISDSDIIKSYLTVLGVDRIKSLGYNFSYMNKELKKLSFNKEFLASEIYKEFKEGDKIKLSEIKERIKKVYESSNYLGTPKAVDLEKFFEVRVVYIQSKKSNGEPTKSKGYELLKKKDL